MGRALGSANPMIVDIINVVSVTSQAVVNQMIEDNDEELQSSLYWRQALDVRTLELSVSIMRSLLNDAANHVYLVYRTGVQMWPARKP